MAFLLALTFDDSVGGVVSLEVGDMDDLYSSRASSTSLSKFDGTSNTPCSNIGVG